MRVLILAHKEALHLLNDKRALFLAFAMPVILLLLFGYVLSLDIKGIKLGVVDEINNGLSRSIFYNLKNLDGWNVVKIKKSEYLDFVKGKYTGILTIQNNLSPQFFLEINGEDPLKASYLATNVKSLILSKMKGHYLVKPLLNLRVRIWYNPELKSRIFIVPGLMVLILILLTALLPSITIAREFEEGTFEQMWITPLKSIEIFIGKLFPYFILGYIQMSIVLLISNLFFEIPLKGLGSFLIVSTLFLFTSSSIGVALSSVTKNEQAAMQFTWLTTFLPSFFLSGFIFPIESMPKLLQAITYLVPARYYLHAIRGILLRGGSYKDFWIDILFLVLFSLLLVIFAVRGLRKK